ncbi:hypothetical protein [Kocuria sp. NPDC057446]|uniref:hypothetical protein n=1 Tax=Kocuria sp. NPDC057446 TaxID=3346137 RepID=UPI00368675C3
MSESFQHGSRDERRSGSSGDHRSGGGAGREGDRSGSPSRRRYDDDRRGPARGGEDRARGSESRGAAGGPGGDRQDDRRGGYAPRGDRRDDRRDDRQGDRRGGYGGDRRRDDRQDDRRGGYAPRGDRRDDRQGDRRDDRQGDRRGGYGGDRRRDDRQDDRRGGYAPRGDRRGTAPDRHDGYRGRRDDRDDVSTHRHRAPEVDEDITGRELDKPTRAQLGALEPRNAEAVAMHLVMAGRYLLDVPELALEHAQAAGRRGGRIAAVREATGIAAYEAGDYALALKELRTFRRMTGAELHLPLMVDCERALGRLDKAVELATSEAVQSLEPSEKVELAIVLAGMRRDQGDAQGAVDALTIPQLDKNRGFPYSPRLFRAYAEALRGVGRDREALTWDRQAVVAEAALGTGQFAEPEIVDFDDEDETEQVPAEGVALTDTEEPAQEPAQEDPPAADQRGMTAGADGGGEGSVLDDSTDDERDDVLDHGTDEDPDGGTEDSTTEGDVDDTGNDADDQEHDLDPDDDFEGGSEADLDPDDDADLGDEDSGDGEDGGPRRG